MDMYKLLNIYDLLKEVFPEKGIVYMILFDLIDMTHYENLERVKNSI